MKVDVRLVIKGLVIAAALAAIVISSGKASAQQPEVVKLQGIAAGMSLAARPDTDLLELSSGRRVSLGQIRRLRRLLQSSPRAVSRPSAFKVKPAASGVPLRTADDLARALTMPDDATVELPTGSRVTVGLIKQLRPEVERRLGRKIGSPGRQSRLSGRAVKVTSQSDWKVLLKKPDDTVLESPGGFRVTVGEVKQRLASGFAAPAAAGAVKERKR